MNISKIILGTANFYENYGLLNSKTSNIQIKKILKIAKDKKIKYLDTAKEYKSDLILKKHTKKFKIYKKIDLEKSFSKKKIFNYLNENHIAYGVTLRKPDLLLKKNGKLVYNFLKELKEKKIIKKIGISIYKTNKLKKIINLFQIDYIQLPLNIVNKTVYQAVRKIIKNRKVEIHARSIFLQGLLLKKYDQLPSQLKNLRHDWKKIDIILEKLNVSRHTACLNFVLSQKVDKVIFGIENSLQLKEILESKRIKENIPIFKIKDKKLIDPIYWLKNL